jgi:hypothetical protein
LEIPGTREDGAMLKGSSVARSEYKYSIPSNIECSGQVAKIVGTKHNVNYYVIV